MKISTSHLLSNALPASALPSRTCWLSFASTCRQLEIRQKEHKIHMAVAAGASPICCSWNLHTILARHFTLHRV